MKVTNKIVLMALLTVVSTNFLSPTAKAVELELNENAPTEIAVETSSDTEMFKCADLNDGIFDLLPQLEELSNENDSVESLIESLRGFSDITILSDGDDQKIVINDVQIFKNASDYENGIQITEGKLQDNMIVNVFYDEGNSWVQYSINPTMPDELFSVPSSTASNSKGFILPLDYMTSDDYTCSYICETKKGVLCDWCIANNQPIVNRAHYAQDISWPGIGGTEIRAVKSGIATVGYSNSYGNWVEIVHSDGYKTKYAHMRELSTVAGGVFQGSIIGKVGNTGLSTAEHLHFEVYSPGAVVNNADNGRVDPVEYLKGASKYIVPTGTAKEYLIADGPLTLRSSADTSSTSYGSLSNGTKITITTVKQGNGNYVFGLISSGTYKGKWIALGTLSGEIYAVDMTNLWKVYDGSLNVRISASTSASSYGTISNGSTFKITDATLSGNYLFAKITSVTAASGSTCSGTTANGKWIALKNDTETYCTPYYK